MFKLIIYILLFSHVNAKVDSECLSWFQQSKLNPNAKGCQLSCGTLSTDLSTFYCPNQCDELCSKIKPCIVDVFWKEKLKSGRPQEWNIDEKTSEWSLVEKDQIVKILTKLPEELKKIPFDGFYRMQKSIVAINPATTSSNGKSIVLYDRAFNNPFWSTEDVVLHELGHVSYLYLSEADRRSFKDKMGWKQSLIGDSSRKGEFVSSRAKDSPEEDFAESFSFFLKNPDFLKEKSIKAYERLLKKYSDGFKYKKDCMYEKK